MFQKLRPILFVLLLATSQPLVCDLEKVVYSSELSSTSIQSVRRLTPQVLLPAMGAVGGVVAMLANRQKYRFIDD